ncbi:MAG: hypothetical protein WC935_00150 [Thermoleophilia bacterium]
MANGPLSERMLEEAYVGGVAGWDDMIDEVSKMEARIEALEEVEDAARPISEWAHEQYEVRGVMTAGGTAEDAALIDLVKYLDQCLASLAGRP